MKHLHNPHCVYVPYSFVIILVVRILKLWKKIHVDDEIHKMELSQFIFVSGSEKRNDERLVSALRAKVGNSYTYPC